ncbi:MAG: FtsX-like permease family protein [Vicinamibacterales bacterium]
MSAPRLARLLVRLAAPGDRRDDTLGDLEEAHRRRAARSRPRAWMLTMAESVVIAAALLRERLRDGRPASGRWLTAGDLRLGLRLMVRQPILTATAVVSLAVGIAVATVGFAFTETLLFSRLPFEGGDRVVTIRTVEQPSRDAARLSAEDYGLITRQATTLEHLGAISGSRENVVVPGGAVETLITAGLTPTSLPYLPARPVAGRLLVPSDGAPGAPPVVMVSARFLRRAMPDVPDAIGRTLEVAGLRRTIVGVLPDEFEFPNSADLWTPIPEGFRDGRASLPGDASLFGILAPGRSLGAARDQLEQLSDRIGHPAPGSSVRLEAAGFTDLGPMAIDMATAAIVAVLAVLLVIAANVGNLILARSFARQREFALRAALGASRRRIVGQIFLEVLLLGLIAAAIGIVAGDAALRTFNRMDELPFWADFTAGPRATAMVVVATLVATMVAGAWPALRATRRDLAAGLHGGDGRASDVRFGRAAGTMVVVQIALSVMLLHGALILAQGFRAFTEPTVPLPRDVLTANVNVNATRVDAASGDRVTVRAEDVERIARGLPGVRAAGLTTALPRQSPRPVPVELDAAEGGAPASRLRLPSAEVTAGFFDAVEGRVLAGRGFRPGDYAPDAPPVAVVNAPFVERVLGGASPLGRRIRAATGDTPGPWRTIVGVVPDLGMSVGDPTQAAGYYVPLAPETTFLYVAMRVTGDPLEHTNPLRRALLDLDPGLIVARPERLEDVAGDDLVFFKWGSVTLVGLGLLTLGLALAGVYAMMSLIVARRTREIGIRLALGATTTRVVRAIVGRAAWQVGTGGAAGCLLALLSLGMRANLASRLGDGGPWTLPVVVVLLLVAGLAATWIPLRRALGVRPGDALRAE